MIRGILNSVVNPLISETYNRGLWVAKKFKGSLEGFDSFGSFATAISKVVILAKGPLGNEGLQQLSDDCESFSLLFSASKIVDTVEGFRSGFFSEGLLGGTKKVLFSSISIMTLLEYLTRIKVYNFATVISYKNVSFAFGKIPTGVLAFPVKLGLLTAALSLSMIENVGKLISIYHKNARLDLKIKLLELDPSKENSEEMRAVRLKRIDELKEKIQAAKGELSAKKNLLAFPYAEKLQKLIQKQDRMPDLSSTDSSKITNDQYTQLVHQASVLHILKKIAANPTETDVPRLLLGVERLIKIKTVDFKKQKIDKQYPEQKVRNRHDFLKTTLGITATAIKTFALFTTVGQALAGLEVMTKIFHAESEVAYKLGIAAIQLVGATIGVTSFIFLDDPKVSHPVDFLLTQQDIAV